MFVCRACIGYVQIGVDWVAQDVLRESDQIASGQFDNRTGFAVNRTNKIENQKRRTSHHQGDGDPKRTTFIGSDWQMLSKRLAQHFVNFSRPKHFHHL